MAHYTADISPASGMDAPTLPSTPTLKTAVPVPGFIGFGGYAKQAAHCMAVIRQALAPVRTNEAASEASFPKPRNVISSVFKPRKGLLISGPSGTGKSHLMRQLAAASGFSVEEIGPELLLQR